MEIFCRFLQKLMMQKKRFKVFFLVFNLAHYMGLLNFCTMTVWKRKKLSNKRNKNPNGISSIKTIT